MINIISLIRKLQIKIDNSSNVEQQQQIVKKYDDNYGLQYNRLACIPFVMMELQQKKEVYEDQSNIQFDECYKCQQSCLLEGLNFVENKCYQCLNDWQLIDYRRYQYCGDGLVAISSMEQCDDGNYVSGDGCYQCKFEFVFYIADPVLIDIQLQVIENTLSNLKTTLQLYHLTVNFVNIIKLLR
ncbi:unnamed protein product [Paramecium octaurelia]|uniref:Uncharacterized protein n=1 Tax=Paramecium octaurelia TaxID=43137 RepID=A0A8S1UTZ5_PAROT|nr:unnamed protein product [Paramecium octaurelia]